MSNYDDFKKKAMDALDTIADVSMEAVRLAEEKARVIARRAKLNAGITKERSLIRRMHVEIGRAYYKKYKDAPDEEFRQSCEEIALAIERIKAKLAELDDLKSTEPVTDAEAADTEPVSEEACCTEDASCCPEEKPEETDE